MRPALVGFAAAAFLLLSLGAAQARVSAGPDSKQAPSQLSTIYFASPTGNIRCRRWRSRPLLTCMTRNNGVLVGVTLYGRAFVRRDGYRYFHPRGPVVFYGERWRRGAFSCLSRFTGMTCQSLYTGRGFFINRSGFRLI